MAASKLTPYERVMARSVRVGSCLIWQGSRNPKGYGKLRVDYKSRQTHRIVYEHHHGPIPQGLDIDHVKARGCKSRACVEITHLEAVTHRENLMRGDTIVARQVAAYRERIQSTKGDRI